MNQNIKLSIVCFITLAAVFLTTNSRAQDLLKLSKDKKFTESTLTFLDGATVKYRAFENIYFVSKVVDSTYQYLNFYVPESAYTSQATPMFLKTNIGGYMASKASAPTPTDATGRALREGYVVVIPGSRGSNSKVTKADGSTYFTGRAPAGIVDLKAAIRYLRHNDSVIPGSAEMIITDGTSAGGAMSSLMGATGNNPAYEPYLKALGAATERDHVFAVVAFCPIIDLEHDDIAYEWLYNATNTKLRNLQPNQATISDELAAQYPAYLNSLNLKKPDGSAITADNYRDYLKSFLMKSAQKAKNEGIEIPEASGIKLNAGGRGGPGEYVIDMDLPTYLEYVVSKQALKTPPAFDKLGVISNDGTPENSLFGDDLGGQKNFTNYALAKSSGNASATIDPALKERVRLLNPMYFISDGVSTTAKYWYIRHGAIDRDAAFSVSINLYTKLINQGYHVNYALPWNRRHQGDYNLDDVFDWINTVVKSQKK